MNTRNRLITISLLYLFSLFFVPPCFSQNYDAEVINFNTDVNYNGNNVKNTYEYEIQINNASGTHFADIEIFYKLNNPPKNFEASIYDIFGNKVRSLKKKEIITSTAFSGIEFHSDHRLLKFKLIHNIFPYIIKYSYSNNFKDYISIAHWSPYAHAKVKTQNAQLTVTVPPHTKLNINHFKIDSTLLETTSDYSKYTWKVKNYIAPNYEPYSPNFEELIPFVKVIPQQFHYGVTGNSNTWKDFGNWECDLINGLDKLTEAETAKVHQLTDSINDKIEKIKTLYHYMQDNTRYILVSLDKGGLIPHPATYVCNNKYGDCKALSNYMKALLKEIEVESYYTSIYAGNKPVKVNPDFPSHQSNHIILCVPVNKDTIWLECTDKTSPFNYLGSFTQNRLALTTKLNNSKLVKTPKHSINNALLSYNTHIIFNNNGNAKFISNARLQGQEFDAIKYFETQYSEKEKKEYIDNIGVIQKTDITAFGINRPHRDTAFIAFHLEGNAYALTEKIGSKTLLKPFKAIKNNLTLPEERKNDLFINYPINKRDTLIYEFTSPIKDIKGISNIELKSDYGLYQRNYKIIKNKLFIYRTFQVQQGRFLLENYTKFYEFYQKSASYDNQKIIIL